MTVSTRKQNVVFHYYRRRSEDGEQASSITPRAWLINNAATYTFVATVQASSVEDALVALREKCAGQGRQARRVQLQDGVLLCAPRAGDVLVGSDHAWLLTGDTEVQDIPYEAQSPWRTYPHRDPLYGLCWSPDGAHIAAAGTSGQVHLYALIPEIERPQFCTAYDRHGDWTVFAVAWSPDGTRIASGGSQGEVHIWQPLLQGGYRDAARGSILICRLENERVHVPITSLLWTPNADRVLAGREDGSIVHWDATTGAFLGRVPGHRGEIQALALSPDGVTVASASEDTTVRLWRLTAEAGIEPGEILCPHEHAAWGVAWSPDGTRLVSGGLQDRHLLLWNPETGDLLERIPLSISYARPLGIRTVAWSPTGRVIAAGCDDGTIQLVDVDRRQHVLSYRTGASARLNTLAWNPDGWLLASGGADGWGGYQQVGLWQAGRAIMLADRQAEVTMHAEEGGGEPC